LWSRWDDYTRSAIIIPRIRGLIPPTHYRRRAANPTGYPSRWRKEQKIGVIIFGRIGLSPIADVAIMSGDFRGPEYGLTEGM
jgi:hypothetical protein